MTDVIKTHANALPAARNIHWNPSPAELRELTSRMPNARHTEYDNYNVQTKVVSRSKGSTYVVTDRPEEHSDQTMTVADGALIAERQDAYIRDQDMLVIDGYIGNDAQRRVPARLYIEAANANIAHALEVWPFFSRQLARLSSVPTFGSRRSLASNFSQASAILPFCFIRRLPSVMR